MGYYKGVLYSMVLRAPHNFCITGKISSTTFNMKVPTSWKKCEAGKKIQERRSCWIAMYYGRVSDSDAYIVNWFPMLWSCRRKIFDEIGSPPSMIKTVLK